MSASARPYISSKEQIFEIKHWSMLLRSSEVLENEKIEEAKNMESVLQDDDVFRKWKQS
jgi:hypothetical protein